MRLALKYEVDGNRTVIERSVEEDWPHDRKSYETWSAERKRIIQSRPADWWRHFPEPAAAMQFATEFGCSAILTGIVYYMTTLSGTHTIYTTVPLLSLPPLPPPPHPHLIRWNLLDTLNFFRLQAAQGLIRDTLPSCETDLQLNITSPKCCDSAMAEAFKDSVFCDVMMSNDLVLNIYRRERVCDECLAHTGKNFVHLNRSKDWSWEALSDCVTESPVPWYVLLNVRTSISHWGHLQARASRGKCTDSIMRRSHDGSRPT